MPVSLGWQVAEAALADEHVRGGERLDLQRRILRLGKPPRRWKTPPWAASLPRDPPEVARPHLVAPVPKGVDRLALSTPLHLASLYGKPLCDLIFMGHTDGICL